MAGFFYYITMMLLGGVIYGTQPPHNVYISLCCHGALYFLGYTLMQTESFAAKQTPILLSGIAYTALRAHLLRGQVENPAGLFIYQIIDGIYLKQLFQSTILPFILPLFYGLVGLFFLVSVKLFFSCNRRLYQKRQRQQADAPDAFLHGYQKQLSK
ncbi:MAG: hypothetical protein ACOX3W_06245 [Christensenellaceae bacterium]